MTHAELIQLGQLVNQDNQTIISTLRAYPWERTSTGTWGYFALKIADWLENPTSKLPFTTFTKGNSKLPFYSFSAMPVITCEGMGSCLDWCYSIQAGWCKPGAYWRQFFNTILLNQYQDILTREFNKLPLDIDLRLYVDGDFMNKTHLEYWMEALKTRPDIKAYGYSKSWKIFLDLHNSGYTWPTNYQLNLSSGSKYDNLIAKRLEALPIYRGKFTAIQAGKAGAKYKGNTKPYRTAVRSAAKKQGYDKFFICPGDCGNCTSKGHACGRDDMQGIDILIGIH